MRIHDRALSTPSRSTPASDAAPRPAQAAPPVPASDTMLCDRCPAAMFRMHAVWRCPDCGYKTDCCGW